MKNVLNIIVLFFITALQINAQGYEWKVISRPSTNTISYVYFMDTVTGFIAQSLGNEAGLRKTTDGGVTWGNAIKNLGRVNSISMSSPLNGWLVTSSGTLGLIHKTTDGGQNWIKTKEQFDEYYQSTKAYSAQKNIVGGYYHMNGIPDTGKILSTSNGGSIWNEKHIIDSVWLGISSTYCYDSLRIFSLAIEEPFDKWYLLRTIDGGNSWERFPSLGFSSIYFLDTLNGWLGRANEIHRTIDGGRSWFLSGTLTGDGDSKGGITFVDSLTGWTFGGIFYQGFDAAAIHHTTDGGKTWQLESVGLCGALASGMMSDKSHGWAVDSYTGYVLGYVPKSLGVKKLPEQPKGYVLRQNYPNPFNPTTTIEYEIPQRTLVTVTVYDVTGKRIQTLVSEDQEAGVYQVKFDAQELSSGTYFYELRAAAYKETKTLTIIR